ncbi:polymorphic toxin-type HINT domain-containing protein [Allorhizocola rhizosphaerae]|uniref:polymorphic toxin-type HINT domain-containing protein n=1 Tax=Allorhizocola rhizosphaerae TaxID=1872709 RepID=UPI001FE6E017|nr:polymorphic toxin-type HINT domain-containing protein [Allorhizocola rhizosphaerae]
MLPYGEDRGGQPTGWMGTKGYVGGTKDPTGYTHLGAREYDPTLGRFISIDPIMDLTDPQQWHAYTYANNSPVTYSDPSGLYFIEDSEGLGQSGFVTTSGSGGRTIKVTGKRYSRAATLTLGGERPNPETVQQHVNTYCGTGGGHCGRFEDLDTGTQATILAGVWCNNNPQACGAWNEEQLAASQAIVEELLGIADAKSCLEGNGFGCVMTVLGLLPIKKLMALKALGDIADTIKVSGDVPWAAFCSFSGDTRVQMADGTTKQIRELSVGDQVLAADPKESQQGARQVTHVWVHDDKLVELHTSDGTILTTEDHPFWNATDQQWQRADALDPGDTLLAADGGHPTVTELSRRSKHTAAAYNLTVADFHTYYVMAGNTPVLVHNSGGCPHLNMNGVPDDLHPYIENVVRQMDIDGTLPPGVRLCNERCFRHRHAE